LVGICIKSIVDNFTLLILLILFPLYLLDLAITKMRPFTKLSSYLFFLVIHHHIETLTAEPLALIPSTQISYHGTTINSIEHFLNIKYAHDTSGLRRFAPPLLFVPPQGTHIDASTAGPACPQTRAAMPPVFAETPDISEDCLHLRIARPQGTMPSDKLPVVIWLHGGGVVKGSGYDPHFDPTNLLTLSRDLDMPVIYVALNYRLTIFGFARTPLLKDQQSLNVGVRDQRVAMQWVKDNIAHFGGDPDRITVYGLSAGGTFASLHLVSYGGETGVPFNRVWSMSGPLGTPLNMSSSVTEMHTSAVARDVGCNQDGDAEVLACLRDVPMEELLDAAMEYSVANQPPAGLFTFIPSVDGDMFPERQSVLYKAGRFVKGTYQMQRLGVILRAPRYTNGPGLDTRRRRYECWSSTSIPRQRVHETRDPAVYFVA
jgi:carboxylesterase type B